MRRRLPALVSLAAPVLAAASMGLTPTASEAFCGFYVAGADAKLLNNATLVVLMRDGKRTVLSMQNDYQGPPEDFALVIPVPVVLKEAEVKTLRRELFERVETLAAPRLVEYWEQDPCSEGTIGLGNTGLIGKGGGGGTGSGYGRGSGAGFSVTVEAEFAVGEYDIVILSAKESGGLDGWLRANGYNIPAGAEPLLRPYVEQGMKFFVAKVDPKKVTFSKDGHAVLSPLRFHYDSEDFTLPVRLGLINAPGGQGGGAKQDLLVHVLAPNLRYQLANYANVTIPTNLDVEDRVRDHFGDFYVSLFEHTLSQHPGAVVTEYAWGASSCDPCPGPDAALTGQELLELGADVIGDGSGAATAAAPIPAVRQAKATVVGPLDRDIIRRIVRAHINEVRQCYARGLTQDPSLAGRVEVEFVIEADGKVSKSELAKPDDPSAAPRDASVGKCIAALPKRWTFPKPRGGGQVSVRYPFALIPQTGGFANPAGNFVLTRLHARYDASSLGEDLVFEAADAIVGGREIEGSDGQIERGASPSGINNFQGRYVIRHPWTGAIACEKPVRGIWGGPPEGDAAEPVVARQQATIGLGGGGGSLASFVTPAAATQLALSKSDEPASEADASSEEVAMPASTTPPNSEEPPGCACASAEAGGAGGLASFGLGLLVLAGLRRRRA